MTKNDILSRLDRNKYKYELSNHNPVYTIEEMIEEKLPYPDIIAKNLFVRDDKKRNYYLITVNENRRINLKEFQQRFNTRRLSFSSENDLMSILGLKKGAVTPFGLLNDKEHVVDFFLGEEFRCGRIGIHPLDNTATVWMKTDDLVEMIKEHGNSIKYF